MASSSYQTAPRAAAPWPACSFFYFFLAPRVAARSRCAPTPGVCSTKNIKVEKFVFMIQLVAEASRIHIPQHPRPLEARDFVESAARESSQPCHHALLELWRRESPTHCLHGTTDDGDCARCPNPAYQPKVPTWGSTPVKVERQSARSSWPPGPRRCEIAC